MCQVIEVPYSLLRANGGGRLKWGATGRRNVGGTYPLGILSTPTKHTWLAPSLGFLTPHFSSTSLRRTPFHTDVLTPAAPQLKPICSHPSGTS